MPHLRRWLYCYAPWLCLERPYAAGEVAGYGGWLSAPLIGTIGFVTLDGSITFTW
jgi:hypothetical protein